MLNAGPRRRRPAFYRHRRIGAGGRVFDCIKFRSMVVDAEGTLRRLLAADPAAAAEWAETQKLRDDPRITRIGRFLRASASMNCRSCSMCCAAR